MGGVVVVVKKRGGAVVADAELRVLYAEPLPPELAAIAREELPPRCALDVVPSRDTEALARRLALADVVIVATTLVDARLLSAAPRLRLVHHQGVGYDNVDLTACRAAGVAVALTPDGTTVGVAEHAMLLMLALAKNLCALDAAVRRGEWPVWDYRARCFELAGKTLGLVGFGRIGREVARRARAFDMRVAYHDAVRASRDVEASLEASPLPLDDLLRTAGVVSLHLPLSPSTRAVIGRRELSLMRPEAVLVNTARGPLVDEAALAEVLAARRIAGAALDVFDAEPPSPANPLLRLENVVLSPHVAAGTRDAFRTKMRAIADNVRRIGAGEPLRHAVAEAASAARTA